ncbi:predicted protein [Botrytis cinerea T4]|uniref:Uncharacterized protein n=1 Tax=Botryotinia fuckeliana (strain T4) TaxID=999810 RepID=G2XW30_BOTF4|nr:predicted protein [Botrytis cinerea T4]
MSTWVAPWYQNDSERRKILEEEALKFTKLQNMTYTLKTSGGTFLVHDYVLH